MGLFTDRSQWAWIWKVSYCPCLPLLSVFWLHKVNSFLPSLTVCRAISTCELASHGLVLLFLPFSDAVLEVLFCKYLFVGALMSWTLSKCLWQFWSNKNLTIFKIIFAGPGTTQLWLFPITRMILNDKCFESVHVMEVTMAAHLKSLIETTSRIASESRKKVRASTWRVKGAFCVGLITLHLLL